MAPGLLSHFMNSPSDYFVSQSDECASFDLAFECGAIDAKMGNKGSVCMAAGDTMAFTGNLGKNGEFSCPRNFHNPCFCNYSDQRVEFLLSSPEYPSPFIRLSHKNVFNTTLAFLFLNLSPLKACH